MKMKRLVRMELLFIIMILSVISTSTAALASDYEVKWEIMNSEGPHLTNVDLVFDSESNKGLLFSGYDEGENDLYDTWVYDFGINSWENMTTSMVDPNNQPKPRTGYSSAYDPISDKIIIFGGFIECDPYPAGCINWNDTWNYNINTNTWTELNPENSPPPMGTAGLIYDSESKKMVLYGGYEDGIVISGETWVYDPVLNNWTDMTPAISPPKRHAPAMSYDSQSDKIIVFGGVDPWSGDPNDHMNDTWSYDLNTNTWTELFPSNSPSKRVADPGMIYISEINKSLLVGGWLSYSRDNNEGEAYNDTWLFDYESNTWTEIPNNFPKDDFWGTIIYNEVEKKCYLFDYFEFKVRTATVIEEITTTTSDPTDTTTENDSGTDESYFYPLGLIILIPIATKRRLKY